MLLAATFAAYHFLPNVRAQNALIVLASLAFYAAWDWRFVPLMIGLSLATYYCAIRIDLETQPAFRRAWMIAFVAAILTILAIFKYFNFFISSAVDLLSAVGLRPNVGTLSIVLPLGISFMTFQAISYVADVYRKEYTADRDVVRVLAYKTFFPQLVAGPIERAEHLLSQFARPRTVDKAMMGQAVWLIVYGYAMKVIFADSLAPIVDTQFTDGQQHGWGVVLGTLAFGLQIYADFCGYSLIAKGCALLFGIELIWNFRYPYWSISLSDFWRRWHIGLSAWLRDYLYIPLGGNRLGPSIAARNMVVTMVLGGLWHGASWNFVLWGLLHGVAQAVWMLLKVPSLPTSTFGKGIGWTATMSVVFIGWFLFRASDPQVLSRMIGALQNWAWTSVHSSVAIAVMSVAVPMFLLESALRRSGDFGINEGSRSIRIAVMSVLITTILALSGGDQAGFIYFEF